MGSRSKMSKRYANRSRAATRRRRQVHNQYAQLPKRFRQHSILDLIIMPFFLLVGEIVNRVRYALWRWTGGRAR